MRSEIETLFHQLADQPFEARAQYFAEHAIDEDTRREVEALLTFDSGASSSLQDQIRIAASRALPQLEAKGWRCGPYRLLEAIGRGGMGTVYLAERVDGEVTQRVAVKLLPPGIGDALRERFLQERQILASLNHSNIARMLDAGHLENGQPFLAMDYVDGKPIDAFASGFSVRQKITLFLKVCAAVAYLHRNLVVHRDLKPSNILVTAEGEPKLLDFGIAKILELPTQSTLTGLRMLTPDYASPEQVTGGAVSTAMDVYGLGAVLFQLLTGRSPHEFPDHSPEAVAYAVTHDEVTRPSKYAPELKGDVDFILLKALRKDPHDRYSTVEQLSDDLEAFLNSRTVRARTGTLWYRTRRFLRRYWVPVTATALVIASLSGGLYIANRQRVIAQKRFEDVRQLANKLFDIDDRVRQLPGSVEARQLIVDTALDYLAGLRADVRGDPEIALDVANAYIMVAEAQGISSGPNLGQIDKATHSLETAQELTQSIVQSHPSNRRAMLLLAHIMDDRMFQAWQGRRNDESLTFARKSAEWLDKFQADKSDKASASVLLGTYANLAHGLMMQEQFDEALRLGTRGSELAALFDAPLSQASLLMTSAMVYRYQGDLEKALKTARESVGLYEAKVVDASLPATLNFVFALSVEGWILGEDNGVSLGRSLEATEVLKRAFHIADDFVHKDPKDEASRSFLVLAGAPLADILRHTDPKRALDIYDHTLRHLGEVDSNFLRLRAVGLLAGSSSALRHLGRTNEARQRLNTAFAYLADMKLYPAEKIEGGSETEQALTALADHEAETGNVPRAIEIYQDLVAKVEPDAKPEISLSGALCVSQTWTSLAALHRRVGHPVIAADFDGRRLALWQQWDHKLPNNEFILRQLAAAR